MADKAIAILHNARMHKCDTSTSGYAVSIHYDAVNVSHLCRKGRLTRCSLPVILQQHHFEFHRAADIRLMYCLVETSWHHLAMRRLQLHMLPTPR